MKFHRDFENYWSRCTRDMGSLSMWQSAELKRIAYRAWRRGRMHEASKRDKQ